MVLVQETAVGNKWLLRCELLSQWEISPVPQGYGGEVWCICGRSVACVMGSPQSNRWVARSLWRRLGWSGR